MPNPVDPSSSRSLQSALAQQSPLVSVIIPAFNAAGHVRAALDSVFAQSHTDFEVILINDGSPDTEQLEQVIQPYISRIIYLTRQNGGPSAARNSGIQRARGEWLAFLDSDDVWLPQYLAEQIKFLREDPALDMVYCDAILAGNAAEGKTFMQICPSSGPVTFQSLLVEQTQVITSGTVVRRQNVMAAGLFDENIRCSEDHDLWLRIVYAGSKIAYQREALLRRNMRADSQGAVAENLLAGEIQSLEKLQQTLDLDSHTSAMLADRLKKIKATHAFVEGKAFLLAQEPSKARESLQRAHTLAPSIKLRVLMMGLRIAPSLTVRAARFWQNRQMK
jgi:cellulose synthase/poly-beta-1,6-N-acetylglucosamine synthase-like glycosyltransferase